jgi:hypothetical protein
LGAFETVWFRAANAQTGHSVYGWGKPIAVPITVASSEIMHPGV